MRPTRGPGRPPLDDDEDSVPVHLKLPASQYDEQFKRATRDRISVPEAIRRTLRDAAQLRNPK